MGMLEGSRSGFLSLRLQLSPASVSALDAAATSAEGRSARKLGHVKPHYASRGTAKPFGLKARS